MKCPKRDASIDNKDKTCSKCDYSEDDNPVVPVTPSSFETAKTKNNIKNNKKIVVMAACIITLLLAGFIVYYILTLPKSNLVPINFNVDIDGYQSEKSTRIPVRVKSDFMNDLKFVDNKGEGFELKPGEYELQFSFSPLSENGNFYKAPADNYTLIVTDQNCEIADGQQVKFEKDNMLELSDSHIDKAAEIAHRDSQNLDKIDLYTQNTKEARAKAIKEEEERKAKEAKKNKSKTWKTAYAEYLKKLPAGLASGRASLIDLAGGDVNALYIAAPDAASGSRLLMYGSNGIEELTIAGNRGIEYVKGAGLILNNTGQQGNYWDKVYQWDGAKISQIFDGWYGGQNSSPQRDNTGNKFKVNNKSVTYKTYFQQFSAVYNIGASSKDTLNSAISISDMIINLVE